MREATIRLYGSAESVVEVFDNWEGMSILSVQFGTMNEGKPEWAGEPSPIDTDMARALGNLLVKMADDVDGQP